MDTELLNFLSPYSQAVQSLATGTRGLVIDTLPGILEMVDPPSKIIAYGYSRKYADLVCAIAPYQGYLNLMFARGTELPDPVGLLRGTGKRARHVRITTREDFRHPAVRELLLAAAALHHA